MLYQKPKGVSYTQMAIYIDKHAYLDERDDNLIFEYIFHIVNMLAHKAKYFHRHEYYEDFAVYMATHIYLRLLNPKQFELKEDGTPKLPKIKSVLNYIKKTIYPRKVDFEQTYYSQAITPLDEEDATFDMQYSFADKMAESVDDLSMVEFDMCLGEVCSTARAFLKKIPYKTDKAMWNNIYLSCVLSFLNAVTLKNKDIKRIKNLKLGIENRPHLLEDLYMEESRDSTILFHLPDDMKDYITVLTNEMKHAIAKDLSLTLHTYVPSDTGFKQLITATVNNEFTYED